MSEIIFLYDKLMLASEQQLAGLDIRFLSYATVNAKMYWFADREYGRLRRKKKKAFIIPKQGTKLVYGALFEINNYDEVKLKLHAYYYSLSEFIGEESSQDLFKPTHLLSTPIKFKKISQLELSTYERGTPIECITFVGNLKNEMIQYNSSKPYYYLQGIDEKNYIELIKEMQNT